MSFRALLAASVLAFAGCVGLIDQSPSPPSHADPDAAVDPNPDPDPDPNPDPDPDPNPDPGDIDAAVDPQDPPPDPDPDPPPDDNCSGWKVGTLTGYNNSDESDDPNAGNVMEFGGLTASFYNHVNMAAVDMSDWGDDSYHYVDVKFNGVVGRVSVWDACRNEDCPDGTDCCTANKRRFATPGYLVDVEARTAQRLWGVADAENTLQDRIEYRVCGSFDPDAIAEQYGAHRNN
jgi:hypothetical protein